MDNLHIPKIQIYITTRCNSKCKLCGTYCPYLAAPRDLSFDAFKKDVTRFFELVDTVGRMELTGGEPLLNPYLPDMLDFLCNFSNRVEDFRLLTNGRSLPSDKLLKAIKRILTNGTGFTVLVDDYGAELSLCAEDAACLYMDTGAKVQRRDYCSDSMYMGGWVDYGSLQKMKDTREQILQNPEKCACVKLQMHSIWEGVIYPCGRGIYYYESPPPPPPMRIPKYPNCILIHDDSKSKEQMREEISKFWYSEYYEVCSYCNAKFSSDKNRFRPAEQLE